MEQPPEMMLPDSERSANDAARAFDDADLLAWLLRLPAVKGQAYFWNYSSRTERKKAMRRDMQKETKNDR
jgi:hypothetical protein